MRQYPLKIQLIKNLIRYHVATTILPGKPNYNWNEFSAKSEIIRSLRLKLKFLTRNTDKIIQTKLFDD